MLAVSLRIFLLPPGTFSCDRVWDCCLPNDCLGPVDLHRRLAAPALLAGAGRQDPVVRAALGRDPYYGCDNQQAVPPTDQPEAGNGERC